MEVEVLEGWGTWEELVLASAVLRHGAAHWEAVVAELRARTFAPGRFTSEACKAKYEDLQKPYSTCSDLLEVLRKQRIAELKRTLEKFDGSIGFLQTKLQTLKAEKAHSSSTESPSIPLESPAQTSERLSSGKDPSKDGLSAGSFTQDMRNIQSPSLHAPAAQIRPQPPSGSSKQEKRPIPVDLVKSIQMELGISVKKKRGKRKRRGCGQVQDVKEEKIDETVLEPTNRSLPFLARVKVEPTSDCDLGSPPLVKNEYIQGSYGSKCDELSRVFDMISSNKYASIFRRRLDSQKRARYRKIVRRHTDLDTIKSRIDQQTITSTKELLRDVLLLATNAAIFYSRNTREHKYAVILKGIIIKLVMEHEKNSFSGQTLAAVTTSPAPAMSAAPVKLESPSPGPGPLDSQKPSEKLQSDKKVSKASQRPRKASKPKDSIKTSSQPRKANRQTQIAKCGSMQQSQVKLAAIVVKHEVKDYASKLHCQLNSASGKEHNVKDRSRQRQPQLKLLPAACVGEHEIKDLSRQLQTQVKLASVNDSKVRKRARRK